MIDTRDINIQTIVNQIHQDEKRLSEGEKVSDIALKIPRIDSGEDKRSGLGHNLARQLFPAKDEDRIGSYIAYGRLLAKLRRAYKSQVAEANAKNSQVDSYRQARMFGSRHIFEQLLSAALSDSILNPQPMPVEVAPYQELEPFFTHMKKGQPANQACQEFTRGAYYDDGRIDMCKQVVGDLYIGNLVESIRENPYVEHFLLGNNIVGDEGASKIASLASHGSTPRIKTYYLAGNCLTEKGAAQLADALVGDRHAESLWLKRNPLKAEGVAHIAKMLEQNSSIRTLDLVNVGMLDEGVKVLFESLRKNKTLRTLYIDANGISEIGASYIADYFEYMKSENRKGLTGLFMAINRLGDAGAERIANAVAGYSHLSKLDLSSNRIQNAGLKVLLEKCNSLPELIYLGIGLYKSTSDMGELPNYFDGCGAELIADFIRSNNTVQIFGLMDTNIREGGFEIIADALEDNHTLLDLQYQQFRSQLPQELEICIRSLLARNIKEQGMSVQEFHSSLKREIKHSDQIRFIDSIYRNNMKDCHICV
ncbi:hypothetical protein ACP6PL_29570 [Dapis sp. BLCC M126]|uniref:hypothetical protein n=1 Tax=Dapis sp. BLCC M126 TaxID=3400189 RepID=UPI003CFA69DF